MDQQQRLLLEVAWEALQDGGQVPENLAGSKTGVFIGIYSSAYLNIQLSVSDRDSINAYTNLGGVQYVTANRISYILNFKAPSLAVDTACSGVAGLIKLALALKHRQIPPSLHFETPNPKIPFEELRLRVPAALEQPRRRTATITVPCRR